MRVGGPTSCSPGDEEDLVQIMTLDALAGDIYSTGQMLSGYGQFCQFVVDGNVCDSVKYVQDNQPTSFWGIPNSGINHVASIIPQGDWSAQTGFYYQQSDWQSLRTDRIVAQITSVPDIFSFGDNTQFSNWALTGFQRFTNCSPSNFRTTWGQLNLTLITITGVHTLTLDQNGIIIAQGSRTGNGSITLVDPASVSGVAGTVTLTYSGDISSGSDLIARFPASYPLYVQAIPFVSGSFPQAHAGIVFDDGYSSSFIARSQPLTTGNHYGLARQIDDAGNESTNLDGGGTIVPIVVPPNPPGTPVYASGGFAATIIHFLASSTTGATYNGYDSGITGILDLSTPSFTHAAGSGTLSQTLAAISAGYTGTRTILVRAVAPRAPIWTLESASEANNWTDVCWSPSLSLFVAVAGSGTHRVMTSPDGVTWTNRTVSAYIWNAVCWSPSLGIFCAVGDSGAVVGRVMTSPDGVTWTNQTAGDNAGWEDVCWSPDLNLFCAVAPNVGSGTHQVMTSPDGVTWTGRASAATSGYESICWSSALGLFCSVVNDSFSTPQVMTSPDGTTWTSHSSSTTTNWADVCWSPALGLFCAVGSNSGNGYIMTSANGSSWTTRLTSASISWGTIVWSQDLGIFVAVGGVNTNNGYIKTSIDGINWTSETSGDINPIWQGIEWAPGIQTFCVVAGSGTKRVQINIFSSIEEGNLQTLVIEYLSGTVVALRPPSPSINQNVTVSGRTLTVPISVNLNGAAVLPTTVKIFLFAPGGSPNYSSPDGSIAVPVGQNVVNANISTTAGSDGEYCFAIRSQSAAGTQDANILLYGVVKLTTTVPAGPVSTISAD